MTWKGTFNLRPWKTKTDENVPCSVLRFLKKSSNRSKNEKPYCLEASDEIGLSDSGPVSWHLTLHSAYVLN
jgi:hypothetical protein